MAEGRARQQTAESSCDDSSRRVVNGVLRSRYQAVGMLLMAFLVLGERGCGCSACGNTPQAVTTAAKVGYLPMLALLVSLRESREVPEPSI